MTFSITTNRGVLVDALGTVALAVSARPTTPILGGVLLDTTDGALTASAFDDETAVTVRVPISPGGSPGRLLVDHREVSKLLAALTKGMARKTADAVPVTITATDTGADATMATGNGHTVPIESYPVEDYPALPDVPSTTVAVDLSVFTREAKRVLVATSGDGTTPALTCVYTQFRATGVVLAATDRYRLCEATMPYLVNNPGLVGTSTLIHGATLATVLKHADDTAGIEIGVSDDGFVSFKIGNTVVNTRSLNVDFPKYKRLLPTETAVTIVVDRATVLLDTQRAAAVLDAKRISPTTVSVTVKPHGAVSVAAMLPTKTASAPDIEANVDGLTEPAAYFFNTRYLANALSTFDSDTITLHLRGVLKPALFTEKPDGLNDDTAFKHLVMPVRTSTR